ncbi:MAG: hypothetical protein EP338_04705 [Bacteroidetes bacterium]|nr:MAG: hypothetical protein EP338_04705 [Bacteroidota bacterium]
MLLFSASMMAQSPVIDWQKTAGGTAVDGKKTHKTIPYKGDLGLWLLQLNDRKEEVCLYPLGCMEDDYLNISAILNLDFRLVST